MSWVIKEGLEWQIRELSEAALDFADEIRESNPSSVSQASYDLAYAQGVGEVLRMLLSNDLDAARNDSEDVLTKIYERYRERVL